MLGVVAAGVLGWQTSRPEGAPARPLPSPPPAVAGSARYVLAGPLPAGPADAVGYRFASAPVDREQVVRIASAVGMSAAPTLEGRDWAVRQDGAVLRVYGSAGQPWVYARADAVSCPPLPLDGYPGTTTASGCAVTPGSGPTPRPPGAPAVHRWGDPVLRAVGLAVAGAQVAAGVMTRAPTLRGRPTSGVGTRIEVDPAGVRAATGWLGRLVPERTYLLLPAQQVFDQLAAERGPQPLVACLGTCPGASTLVVTGARLGLALQLRQDGADALYPAWFFSVQDDPPRPGADATVVRDASGTSG